MIKEPLLVNLEVPVFRIVINVVVAPSCKHAVKYTNQLHKYFYKRFKDDKSYWDSMFGAYLRNVKVNIHAIVLAEDCDIDTIAHEAFHCTHGVLNACGLRFSHKSEEAYAYLHGWLVKHLVDIKAQYQDKDG